jgi:hypothetical protein
VWRDDSGTVELWRERQAALRPGGQWQAARRGTGQSHDDGWKWHGGATLGFGAPAAKLRHSSTTASEGEHGGCGTYPETTTGLDSEAPGQELRSGSFMSARAAGGCRSRWPMEARHLATESPTGGPHASLIFKFQKNSKILFRTKK